MANPLLRVNFFKTGTNTDRPHEIAPTPEHYAGDNHPYRGVEPHGVEDTVKPHDPDVYGVDPDNPNQGHIVGLVEPEKIPDPVPVRVVNEYKKELRRFGTDRITLDFTTLNNAANRPVEIVGRSEDRASIRLRNLDATNYIIIAGSREVLGMKGYPLVPGAEVELQTEDPVFAIVTNPTLGFPNASAILAILTQYRTKEG